MLDKALITLNGAEFAGLVTGKTAADALIAIISEKKKLYTGISREEVELLYTMFCAQEGDES